MYILHNIQVSNKDLYKFMPNLTTKSFCPHNVSHGGQINSIFYYFPCVYLHIKIKCIFLYICHNGQCQSWVIKQTKFFYTHTTGLKIAK